MLEKLYREVKVRLEKINFNDIFDGFHMFKFAIYNENEACFDGKIIPKDKNFYGNTAIEFHGEIIAIWDYAFDPVEDMDKLAYLLVHEMFHCYQRERGESRWPDDFILMSLSGEEYFNRKYCENRALAEGLTDERAFYDFCAMRKERISLFPEAEEELKAETIEGLAEFCGLKALKFLSEDKYNAIANNYAELLKEEGSLVLNARKSAYYSGAIFFICADKYGVEYDRAFCGGTHFESAHFKEDSKSGYKEYPFIKEELKKLDERKAKDIESVISHAEYKELRAFICGYDPMNMFRHKDFYFCRTFVAVNADGERICLKTPCVLMIKEGTYGQIEGYYSIERGEK